MTITLTALWVIVTAIVAVGSAIILLLNKRRVDIDAIEKTYTDELRGLADTRKEIIEQLRSEMAEQARTHAKEISNLENQIAELRGQYEAMRRFQAREIIDSVTEGVLAGLGALDL